MRKYFVFLVSAALLFSFSAAASAVVLSQGDSVVKIGEDINMGARLDLTDLVAINGNINVKGRVANNVVCVFGTVHLFPTARVGGDVVAIGGSVIRDAGARVGGTVKEGLMAGESGSVSVSVFSPDSVDTSRANLVIFLGLIGLAILFVAFKTKQVGIVSSYVEKNWWKALLWGLLGALLALPLAALLAVTIIGIPLILVEMVIISLALSIGFAAVSQLIGKLVTRAIRRPNQPMMAEAVIGVIVIYLANLIPLGGGLICVVLTVMGFGSALANRLGFQK